MRDLFSHDVSTAAHLAREEISAYLDEGPTRAEAEADRREDEEDARRAWKGDRA